MRQIFVNARALRGQSTDAERRLWTHLRGGRMHGAKFRRQFPIAGFVADFACPALRLVIELDGGQHVDRAHEDAQRSEKLAVNGYRVIRFWNDAVLLRLDDVLDEISRNVLTPPQPSPASRGGSTTPEA